MPELKIAPTLMKRKYLVNKRFQFGFILKLCTPVFLMGGLSIFLVYHNAHQALLQTMYKSHLASRNIGDLLEGPIVNANLTVLGITSLCALLAVLYIAYRANAALAEIESRLKGFGQAKAPGQKIHSSPLWNWNEEEAAEEFRSRLQDFKMAESTLAIAQGLLKHDSVNGQAADRIRLQSLLRQAESQCRDSLNRFQLN